MASFLLIKLISINILLWEFPLASAYSFHSPKTDPTWPQVKSYYLLYKLWKLQPWISWTESTLHETCPSQWFPATSKKNLVNYFMFSSMDNSKLLPDKIMLSILPFYSKLIWFIMILKCLNSHNQEKLNPHWRFWFLLISHKEIKLNVYLFGLPNLWIINKKPLRMVLSLFNERILAKITFKIIYFWP